MGRDVILLSLLNTAASAATWGDPARTSDVGIFEARLTLNHAARAVELGTCTGDGCVEATCTTENCATTARDAGAGLRLVLRPFDFLGLWAEAGLAVDAVDGTTHQALARDLAAGLHLALPRRGVRPALSARVQWIEGAATDASGSLVSAGRGLVVDLAATAVFGDTRYGASAWAGPVGRVLETRSVALVEEDLEMELHSSLPIGAVLGGELVSRPLGLPWRGRTPRLSAGLEARGVDEWGLSGWVGVIY